MQADKLRACPFCGDAAKLIESVDTGEKYGGPSWKVACESPMTPCIGGFINLWQCTPEDAVAAWNKRAAIAEAAEDLRADAMRYRWLRDNRAEDLCVRTRGDNPIHPHLWGYYEIDGRKLDVAIDKKLAALSTVAPVREG